MRVINTKATVFGIERLETRKNTFRAMLSTLKDVDQEGNKTYSSWPTYFVGEAFEKAKTVKEKEFIEILKGKVENTYNRENKKVYIRLTVFDFDIVKNKPKEEADR